MKPIDSDTHSRHDRSLVELAKSRHIGTGGDLEQALMEITETAASSLSTERVSIWFYNQDRSAIDCVDLYEHAAQRHSRGTELTASLYPHYFKALEEDRTIAAHDAGNDPRTREFSGTYLAELGITSMLDVPIRVGGRMVGVVCHEHVGPPRRWSDEDRHFAASVGDIAALALEASERRKAEESVRRSERHFRALIENSLDVLLMLGPDGTVVYASPSIRKMLGHAPAACAGGDPVDWAHPEDQPGIARFRRTLTEKPGAVLSVEARLRNGAGEWRLMEMAGQNLLDDPDVAGIVLHMTDVTERRQAEKLLRDYRTELENAVEERTLQLRAKNEELAVALGQLREAQHQLLIREKLAALASLVAGVSHELNNPIGAILSSADVSDRCVNKLLLAADERRPEFGGTQGYVAELLALLKDNNRVIVEAAGRVSSVVRSLRRFAHLDEAELQEADLHEEIESTLTLVQHQIGDRVSVIKDFGVIPKVLCFPSLLNQVFASVITNSLQAIDGKGAITIRTFADADSVHIKFLDNGRGIPRDLLDHIFEPGFTTRGTGVGTGLGLALSHRIVQKHRGRIDVESEVGRGTEITLTLPIRASSA